MDIESFLERARALRNEAWAAVTASPAFATFKTFDDTVVALGGGSVMPALTGSSVKRANGAAKPEGSAASGRRTESTTRISHGDAANAALREKGEPLPLLGFMNAAIAKGAVFSGSNAVSNFRSAVSKDDRFAPVMRKGKYFWWFKGEDVPPGWNETAGRDLLTGPAASSVNSNQEGGEGHAAAPT